MRSPSFYHLSFLLPTGARPLAGAAIDMPADCEIRIVAPLVKIWGASQAGVFEAASAALRAAWRERPPVSIAAVLASPGSGAGRDPWTIIVGADVAFSPTGLGATFPAKPLPREIEGLDAAARQILAIDKSV